jgi:hypothetical protein
MQAKREFNKTRNRFNRDKSAYNKTLFLQAKKSYNTIKRKSKQNYKKAEGARISRLAKDDSRAFWKNIKNNVKNDKNVNSNITLNEMYDHFNDLLGNEADDINLNPNGTNEAEIINDTFLDREFDLQELRHAVFSQKNSKSPGNDNLIAEIFKTSFEIIHPFLLKFYNHIFENNIYPKYWAEGVIVPIFKGGDPNSTKNFRGIILNNILAKIYSKLLNNRLTKWSIANNKIIDNQFGFQKNKSTVDCVFILHAIISKTLANKKKLYVAFLDWEKMFDRINRPLLWQKMANEYISTKLLKSVKSMYSQVKLNIKYNKHTSNTIYSKSGLKQGDSLSSLLCLFFINDIIDNINNNLEGIIHIDEMPLFSVFFADDAILFSYKPESLQSMLTDVENYSNEFNLRLNVNKTKIMIFEKGRKSTYNFFLYNTKIEIVESFKYLGVYLFKNNNWYRTQKVIAQHSLYSLHNLFIILNQTELSFNNKKSLFDSLIFPKLNFSAEVWGYHEAPDIEKIHTKFCRKILSVKQSTNLDALYGELGNVPLKIRRKISMIKYWLKLITNRHNTILFKVYNLLKQDVDSNFIYNGNNWAYQIKLILDHCGLSNLWLNQYNMNINFESIKRRITDIYMQEWYTSINNSNRLETLALFKHSFKLENYLDYISENKYRIALTRFRISSHDLLIETGRHANIERQHRICKNCNMNMIETEFHFLLVCPKYRDFRKKYLKKYYYTWPTIPKFINLLSSNSKYVVNSLAKCIFYSNKIRE